MTERPHRFVSWKRRLALLPALDLRSLALFRILLGALILADLGIRLSADGLVAHYSDAGCFPRSILIDGFQSPGAVSLHLFSGQPTLIAGLFLVQALFAGMLLLGIRARWATAASWLLAISLQNRNPAVLHGADPLIRAFLFWGMFLPLDRRWAFDSRKKPRAPDYGAPFVSVASLAFILQLCLIYWCPVALRTSSLWWNGQALSHMLQMDVYVTPFGQWLARADHWLPFLTHASMYWEMLGPLLLFVPFKPAFFRTVCVFGFIGLHLAMELCLALGLFPWVSIAVWTALLPSAFWRALARGRLGGLRRPPESSEPPAPANPTILPASSPRTRHGGEIKVSDRGRSIAVNAVATLFLAFVVAWNIRSLDYYRFVSFFPESVNPVGRFLGLNQYWNMFAPGPQVDDGWFVFEASLKDGSSVDLLAGAPVTWSKPPLVADAFPNQRWSKFLYNLTQAKYAPLRGRFGEYRVRRWNRNRPSDRHVEAARLFFIREPNPPTARRPTERVELWSMDSVHPRVRYQGKSASESQQDAEPRIVPKQDLSD